ncbi:MAG: nitrilase-related carbon-nitrogen hydrolase [Candidatus Chlorobium antarcticum]|jgi:predicted amidohydrolase|nr:nitrilase-related carbon-nitrogen hydrolase [Candidatus Chlorobium antarcticum]
MERLNIALIHLDVRYADPEHNRKELVRLNRQAALAGARIIVNTELAVSGYSFRSPEEVSSCAESMEGVSVRELAGVAAESGCYIVLGYPEVDPATGIFYNSAAVIAPDGKLLLNYRKVTAEVRWACPGSHKQDNTFDTPWGRVAVLICSDTYYGVIPRRAALCGADLFLVSANWPGGSLDPREIWRARARENGCSLVACNRTGKDRTMECQDAFSCAYASDGSVILERSSPVSEVFHLTLPLVDGRLPSARAESLRTRVPEHYRAMYLDMRYAADMTAYHALPAPEIVPVYCLHGSIELLLGDAYVDSQLAEIDSVSGSVVVLPLMNAPNREEMIRTLKEASLAHGAVICTGIMLPNEPPELLCCRPDGSLVHRRPGSDEFSMIDLDHLRIALLSKEESYHPESVTALAKQGCDIAVVSAMSFDAADRLVLGSRSIEQVAVAASGANISFICMPPVDHYRWEERFSEGSECASMEIDVEKLRKKRFFDRIDAELLLDGHKVPVSESSSINSVGAGGRGLKEAYSLQE